MKVLIVDDSRAMQTIVRRGIEQLGYDDMEIRNADNGKDALDMIRTWEPTLVLSDWHMPEMNGLELLHALNRQMLSVQIGFVTTETSESRKIEALAAGAKFFVQKPFDQKTLHEAVLPILQGSTEGENALEEEQPEEHESNPLSLPAHNTVKTIIEDLSRISLRIEHADSMRLKERDFPCLISLFEDAETKKIRAVAVMDISATCILGASITAIPPERVKDAINEKAIPKAIINNCRKIMEQVSTTLNDQDSMQALSLRSINIMRQNIDGIENLLAKPGEKKVGLTISAESYGNGKLTIVAS